MRCLQPPVGPAADLAAAISTAVPGLETARLRLRAPRIDDFAAWREAWADLEPDWTERSAFADFCVYVAGWMLHGHGVWTIERRDTGEVAGFVLLGLEWGDQDPEIGYALLPDARGRGLATEAAAAVRDFALSGHLPAPPVTCIAPDNAASVAVARRLGAARDHAAELALDDDVLVYRHGPVA